MAPRTVDPDRMVNATQCVMVRMTDTQMDRLRAYARQQELSYGAAFRSLMDMALQGDHAQPTGAA